jgi:RHS repeat-associated protein
VYNALGQRVEMKNGAGTSYTELAYDSFGNMIALHNRTTFTQRTYYLGGRPFARHQDNKTYFLHPDHLGSTVFVTDETGATIQKTIYYPWGQAWATAGSLKDNRFASMDPRDAETGNDPTLFRLYNPRLYRWLSPDALAGNILNPQSLNRYAYVLNNPTNLIDPLGLDGWNPADPCNDPMFAASHAQCGYPPVPCFYLGHCPPMPPIPPGGGGHGGGGGGAHGGTGPSAGGMPTTGMPSGGGAMPTLGNAFLGFHILCVQIRIGGGPPDPASCSLYFFGQKLIDFRVLADLVNTGVPIAGAVTVLFPIPQTMGTLGGGFAVPMAFNVTGTKFGCIGLGPAFGTTGKTANFGPLVGGNLANQQSVLSGASVSVNYQGAPAAGAQAIWNFGGMLFGPTGGSLGFSASFTLSGCW